MNTKHANPAPAAGFARYSELLIFAALVLFFLISFPGNRSEADDGFHYAYLVKTQGWAHLLQPRYLLFLPICKVLYQLTALDPYLLMCILSSFCSAGTLLLCYRFLSNVMQLPRGAALWGCAFLLFSYGYWRYSVEAEVYSISNLLCTAVLYIILSRRSVVLAGLLAGLAVLIYKPNAMPLFFVFPFAFLIKRRWIPFFVYPAIGGIVVLVGYFLAYRYVGSSGAFVQFLAEGASRSYGSVFVTIFVVLSNVVATGFLYGIDAVEHFIRSKFPANLIVEEVYAANANGFRNHIAIVTLVLLAVSMVTLLIMALRRFSRRNLNWEQGILLCWIIVYAGVLLYLDPNSPEPWTMLLVPLMLLLTAVLFAPLFENLRTRRFAWIVIAILFLHNFAGGYGVIATEKSDYIAQRTGWLKHHAQQGDLVLSLGSRSTLAYIVYKTPAEICSPEQAFGRCMQLAEETIAAGHKVYLMDDMVNREAAVKFRGGKAFAEVEEFVTRYAEYLVLVNPDDKKYGRVYELRYNGKLVVN